MQVEKAPKTRISFAKSQLRKARRKIKSLGNATPKSVASTKTVFGNPSEFADDSSLGSRDIPIEPKHVISHAISNSPSKEIFKAHDIHEDHTKIVRQLICQRPSLPDGMFYLDKEFMSRWSWTTRLDIILSHIYMVIDRASETTICTGLRINGGEILVPGHFPDRDMSRSILQRLPEVPKVKIPKFIHNFYQPSPTSRGATLFLLSNEQPTYRFGGNLLRENTDPARSFLLFAWKRTFVVAPLSSLSDETHPVYHASGAVCVTLPLAANSESNAFVVSGMYLGDGCFLSDEEMLSHGFQYSY